MKRNSFSDPSKAADPADVRRIGIPRALLYYRYGALWRAFFEELGRTVIVSEPSDRGVFEAGDAVSVDECCLASKLYLGHVAALIDRTDALFIPSIANLGHLRSFCTKFQALPDLVANSFSERDIRIISCLVEEQETHTMARESYLALARRFGATPRQAKAAWKAALHAQDAADRMAQSTQEHALARAEALPKESRPLRILVMAHPYVAHDPYIGGPVADMLIEMGACVLFADHADKERAFKMSLDFSETLPWIVNRELVGALMLLHDHVDGVVIVSAFPCGPDSMTNDAVTRRFRGKPTLVLTVDAQSGTAGMETRIESFVDILRYQGKGGYLHVR